MLKVDLRGLGLVSVRESVPGEAQYEQEGLLTGRREGGPLGRRSGSSREVRALVEVQRRFGGLAPRAVLGGKLVTADTDEILVEVVYGSDSGSGFLSSELWNKPLTVGLPKSFASAALQAIVSMDNSSLLNGTLLVDRAGFDAVESAEPIFSQAATVLVHVLAALLRGSDVEKAVVRAVESW
jgi:hypothetical protein